MLTDDFKISQYGNTSVTNLGAIFIAIFFFKRDKEKLEKKNSQCAGGGYILFSVHPSPFLPLRS